MIKKITALSTALFISMSSTAMAQDDVSIMDLKETVYLLMKDVQAMKASQKTFTKNSQSIVNKNDSDIEMLKKDIASLQKQIKDERNTDVLSGYKVSSELKKFANKH
jgi:capsule polysaccharide export protein KpsE/RkpR